MSEGAVIIFYVLFTEDLPQAEKIEGFSIGVPEKRFDNW